MVQDGAHPAQPSGAGNRRGDMNGGVLDLIGVMVLVGALGSYGGLW
jgi:hypothetical protein